MATFSITVSSGFNILGGGKANVWGSAVCSSTLTWESSGAATFKNLWGAQNDIQVSVTKQISSTMTFASDPQKIVTKQVDNSLDMTSTVGKRVTKQIDDTLNTASTMVTLTKQAGDWSYVFPSDTTNIQASTFATYTSINPTSTSWTQQTTTSTSWTGV